MNSGHAYNISIIYLVPTRVLFLGDRISFFKVGNVGPILLMRRPRLTCKVTAGKWCSQDSNPGFSDPTKIALGMETLELL